MKPCFLAMFLFVLPGGLAANPAAAGTGEQHRLAAICRSLRLAIQDLRETHGAAYACGQEYLSRLDLLERKVKSGGPGAHGDLRRALEVLQRQALVANPLLCGQPILFVVRHQYRSHYHAIDTLFHTGEFNVDRGIPHADLFQGGGALKVIDLGAGGKVETLLEVPAGIARDPQVHFGGKKIVFALRRNAAEDYSIWEIGTDGKGLRQLTSAPGVSDFDPIYLPDDSILFSSTREPKYNMCSRDHGANLFRMDSDGANIHQITKNTLFDNHASLLSDGTILYARWEYVDRNFGDAHGLWTVNPDGTNQAVFWGNNTAVPGAVFNAHEIPGTHRILCVLGPHHDRLWGALAIIDRSRGLDGRPPVIRTWPPEAIDAVRFGGPFDCDLHARTVRIKYEDPWPLGEKYFLCSRMTGEGERMGIYLVDVFGNEILLHAEGPGCYDPMPLKPSPRPPRIPRRRDFENREGTFYVMDVYRGTHLRGVPRGTVKRLRVVESPEKRHWSRGSWNGQGYTAPGMNWHSLENKRILGTVPVEEDGSASFRVPADTFVYFQLLDERGMMVQSMRSGTLVQSGETSSCVGCHDDRLAAPPHRMERIPSALRRSPSRLKDWFGPPRLFSFTREVQPVLTRRCVSCHDYGKEAGRKLNLAPDRTLTFNTAYQELWRKGYVKCVGGGPAEIQPAYAWGSHASPLIRELRNPRIPEHGDIRLSPEEFDRLVTWVDLNGVYYPTYACAYPESRTGRIPLDLGELEWLGHLTGIPFNNIMNFQSNPGPLVSFDRPIRSLCLEGIDDRSSPEYREALRLIEAGRDRLEKHPRADMPGFRPCQVDLARERRYAVRREIEERNREAIRRGWKRYDRDQPPVPPVPFPDSPRVNLPAPPENAPFHPRRARLTDARGTGYRWLSDCGNDILGDHLVYGGWEDPRDCRNYLAFGRARLRGRWRTGLVALAFPDHNRLHAEWPLEAGAGKKLRALVGLTDTAFRETRTGATVRLTIRGREGDRILLDEVFPPGDRRLVERDQALTGNEKALILEVDNRGSEHWSVVFLEISLGGLN